MQRQYHIESSIFQGLGRRKEILDMKFKISFRILGGKRFRSRRNLWLNVPSPRLRKSGVCATVRFLIAKIAANECYGDFSPIRQNHRRLLGVLRPETCIFVGAQQVRQYQTDYEHNKGTDGEKDAKITAEMANCDDENQTSGNSYRLKKFTESSFGHDHSALEAF